MYSTISQLNTIFIPSKPGFISIRKFKIIIEVVANITPQGFTPISVYNSIEVYLITLYVVPFRYTTNPFNPTYDIFQSNHQPFFFLKIYPPYNNHMSQFIRKVTVTFHHSHITTKNLIWAFNQNWNNLHPDICQSKHRDVLYKHKTFTLILTLNTHNSIHNFCCSYTQCLGVSNIHKGYTEAKYEFKERDKDGREEMHG